MTYRVIASSSFVFTMLAIVAIGLGVTARTLTPMVVILTAGAITSFLVLTNAARRKPRIGALTERAFIAFLIAVLGTVSCAIVINTDAGHPLFDAVTASLVFRIAIIAVLAVPSVWLVLWYAGRLGEGKA